MFREGPHGFNVPFGNYKNPGIVDKNHIMEVHTLIQPVEFRHGDFSEFLNKDNIKNKDDFVYLDPPYALESENSFVGYNKCGFSSEKQGQLFNLCDNLSSKFLMSNSDVEVVRNFFEHYNILSIVSRRSINSKNPESTTAEVLIKNY